MLPGEESDKRIPILSSENARRKPNSQKKSKLSKGFPVCGKGQKRNLPQRPYSVMTVDCPEMSNRLRQRKFLQAITSSLRTM
jgi:hypothetical protein